MCDQQTEKSKFHKTWKVTRDALPIIIAVIYPFATIFLSNYLDRAKEKKEFLLGLYFLQYHEQKSCISNIKSLLPGLFSEEGRVINDPIVINNYKKELDSCLKTSHLFYLHTIANNILVLHDKGLLKKCIMGTLYSLERNLSDVLSQSEFPFLTIKQSYFFSIEKCSSEIFEKIDSKIEQKLN
ncbi:MAG: hypothetical protein HQK51_21820 [Oligoflexia bacterium]|nr:hypothetical protein [Oligoflexia bacterium]